MDKQSTLNDLKESNRWLFEQIYSLSFKLQQQEVLILNLRHQLRVDEMLKSSDVWCSPETKDWNAEPCCSNQHSSSLTSDGAFVPPKTEDWDAEISQSNK